MSWTRKNDGARLYQEPGGGYLLLIPDEELAVGNVYEGLKPSLCGAPYPCASYLTRCKRVAWNDLPQEWRDAFRQYMRPHEEGETPWNPADYRGLWRIDEGPDNLFTVGLVPVSDKPHPCLGWFKSEQEAAAFIETLPKYEDGRYYLDSPAALGEQ